MTKPAHSPLSSACLLFFVVLLGAATVTAQGFYMGAGGRDGRTSTAPIPTGGTEGAGPVSGGSDEGGGDDDDCALTCDCITWLLGSVAKGGVATDGAHYQSVPVPHPVATGMSQIICTLECISISGGEGSGCGDLHTDEASEPGGFI
jgi:hypothetical protein